MRHAELTLSTKVRGRGRFAVALYCIRCTCGRFDSLWLKTPAAARASHARHVANPHSGTCPNFCRECGS